MKLTLSPRLVSRQGAFYNTMLFCIHLGFTQGEADDSMVQPFTGGRVGFWRVGWLARA